MDRRVMAICGFLIAAPPLAAAEEAAEGGPPPLPVAGPYLMFDFSAGSPNDPQAAGVYEADLGMELGTRLGAGYDFDGPRLEAQLGYERFYLNNVNPVPGSPLEEADTTGDLKGLVMMANLYYDFGVVGGARPFLGGGIGFAKLEADYHGFYCTLLPPGCYGGEKVVTGSDTVTAWQAMAGLSMPLRSGRGYWFLGYRYFGTDDIGLNVVGVGPVTQEGVEAHSIMLGWRFMLRAF